MPAARYDLHIEQGSTLDRDLLIKVNGAPFDLTDWVPSGQIRKTHRSIDIVATFSFTCPTTGYSLTDGRMTLLLAADITAAMPCGETETDARSKYVYDIELTGRTGSVHDGEVKRLMEGIVYVSPEVTRDDT